jgi:hypothetical protein
MVLIITVCIVMSSYTGNGYKKQSESNIDLFISIEKETTQKNEETRIDNTRAFLEKNKVFFEIFSSVLLGVMSIIISVVGTQINNKTKKIYKKQLEILENDREPYFVLKCRKLLTFFPPKIGKKKKYILKNIGGLISCVDFDIDLYFEINVWYYSSQCYRFKVRIDNYLPNFYPKKIGRRSIYDYDAKNKQLIFYECNYIKIDLLRKDAKDKFEKNLNISIIKNSNAHISVFDRIYIHMSYVDYKNKYCVCEYKIEDDGILITPISDYYKDLGAIELDYIEHDIETIAELVKKEIQSKRETSD